MKIHYTDQIYFLFQAKIKTQLFFSKLETKTYVFHLNFIKTKV